MVRPLGLAAAAMLAGACASPTSATLTTGLTGTVLRGPVTPVCTVNAPCNVPFGAGFSVDRGGTVVAHFRSDENGRFTVMLAPGAYRVIPDPDAPMISPASQARSVTVQDAGLTTVTLEFDTGIRQSHDGGLLVLDHNAYHVGELVLLRRLLGAWPPKT